MEISWPYEALEVAEKRSEIPIHVRARGITEFGASDGESVYKMRKISYFLWNYGREPINLRKRAAGKLEK